MSRPFKGSTVQWKNLIKEDVAIEVELRLYNHARRTVNYGARSALINMLLERWLIEQKHLEAQRKEVA
jgi:hypothetical protein